MIRFMIASVAAIFLTACASSPSSPPAVSAAPAAAPAAPKLKDGEVVLPSDYKSWPRFLPSVDRTDNKQIRDIYINPTGAKTNAGDKFPNGTISVMEIYKAHQNPDGSLRKGADGSLTKDGLSKIFVMQKGAGWGELAPEGLKNGDWSYSAYMPNGTASPEPTAACRGCHLPLGESKDFVHRYDEYFEKRAKAVH